MKWQGCDVTLRWGVRSSTGWRCCVSTYGSPSEHRACLHHKWVSRWGWRPWKPNQCPSRYHLAVTQRKEEEPGSSSIFNQNDPWTPTVDFTDFINNETIAGQVSW